MSLESLTGVPPKDDERTAQQRRADALMELCRRQLDSGTLPRVNGRKPHLMVVAQADTLAGRPGAPAPQLEGAGPICVETARRLLCDGSASVLTVDKSGVALDLGRARRLASEYPNYYAPSSGWECSPSLCRTSSSARFERHRRGCGSCLQLRPPDSRSALPVASRPGCSLAKYSGPSIDR